MMLDGLRRRLFIVLAILVAVAGGIAWLAFGCGINDAIKTAAESGADRIMAPLSTELFWYEAASGILRAWTEAFPPGGTTVALPDAAPEPWWYSWAASATVAGAYILSHRFPWLRIALERIKGVPPELRRKAKGK